MENKELYGTYLAHVWQPVFFSSVYETVDDESG